MARTKEENKEYMRQYMANKRNVNTDVNTLEMLTGDGIPWQDVPDSIFNGKGRVSLFTLKAAVRQSRAGM